MIRERKKTMKKYVSTVLTICLLFAMVVPASAGVGVKQFADTVYLNGTIVTVDERNTIAEGVAVKGDTIMAIGSKKHIIDFVGPDTEIVNLAGNTMLPGFYDSHSHFMGEGFKALFQVDLNSKPIGTMTSIDDYIVALKAKAESLPAGTWITATGYDDTMIIDQRHPTREDLDKASTEHPIVLNHISGHIMACNSKALEIAGITKDTKVPAGSAIRLDQATGEPTGILEESGAINLVRKHMPQRTVQEIVDAIGVSADLYAAAGVTTANEGGNGNLFNLKTFVEAEKQGKLDIRTVLWFDKNAIDQAVAADPNSDKITVGGVKMFQDGSIQGYTGYLTAPYYVPFEGDSTYVGYPTASREDLAKEVKEIHDKGYTIYTHGNGDAAIDDILYAYVKAQKENPRDDVRHTVIHSQMMREDQLDIMQEYGFIPSFFPLHTYYWGDRHVNIFMGPERAANMSPTKWALDRDMIFTTHCDTPVIAQTPLLSIWSTVNRVSTGGEVIGSAQRIPVLDAIKSYTIYGAYQNSEEKEKGSIEVGKLADFVILDKNPLTVQPMEIKDIKVVQTIVGNESVYAMEKK